jgi:hypothetical protein
METGAERSAVATSRDIDRARMLAVPLHLLFTFGAALVLAFLVLAMPLVRLLGLPLVLTMRTVFLA